MLGPKLILVVHYTRLGGVQMFRNRFSPTVTNTLNKNKRKIWLGHIDNTSNQISPNLVSSSADFPLARENIRFSSLFVAGDVSRGGSSARNVRIDEERGETDVFAGYFPLGRLSHVLWSFDINLKWILRVPILVSESHFAYHFHWIRDREGGEVQKIFVQGKISWNKLREHRFSVLDRVIAPPLVFVFLQRRQKIEIKTGRAIGSLVIRSPIFDRICQLFADTFLKQATPSGLLD